ncbi:hypothetical protein M885DRAFT_478523 [Pelagophyceae sp. CCMP2097]|nr:hypothetical protein M885DRAFT_478523 [Pelagophyceae sp. CCMP2097]
MGGDVGAPAPAPAGRVVRVAVGGGALGLTFRFSRGSLVVDGGVVGADGADGARRAVVAAGPRRGDVVEAVCGVPLLRGAMADVVGHMRQLLDAPGVQRTLDLRRFDDVEAADATTAEAVPEAVPEAEPPAPPPRSARPAPPASPQPGEAQTGPPPCEDAPRGGLRRKPSFRALSADAPAADAPPPALQALGLALAAALRDSPEMRPLHVSLRDESAWYRARGAVGGARHWRRDVVAVRGAAAAGFPRATGFEGFYYCAANGDAKARRTSAGTAGNALKAFKLADAACAQRDAARADVAASLFVGDVVSEAFVGLAHQARWLLVTEALVRAVDGKGDEARLPRGFLRGAAAAGLPFCATLAGLGQARLCLRLLTPAQWRPKDYAPDPAERSSTTRRPHCGPDAPGGPPTKKVSGTKYLKALLDEGAEGGAKSDGPLGHFYHSLPTEQRAFLLRAQRTADAALLAEPGVAAAAPLTPKSALAGAGPRDVAADAAFRNAQAAAWHAVAQKREALACVRLQRIWRCGLPLRALRHRNSRHLAAVRLQQRLRGLYGRLYARLYRAVMALAATRIAARYRILLATRKLRARRKAMNAAALAVQILARRWMAAAYVQWVRVHSVAATTLARHARGFLGRCTAKLAVFLDFYRRHHEVSGQIHLAKTARAAVARKAFAKKLAGAVTLRVVLPSHKCVQRLARGRRGRLRAALARHRRWCAKEIQRVARGMFARAWRRRLDATRLRWRAAALIERVARGQLDRSVVSCLRRHQRHVFVSTVLVPAAQARARGMLGRSAARARRRRVSAAKRILREWRLFCFRREARREFHRRLQRRRSRAATEVQRQLRGVFARARAAALSYAAAGVRIKAARVILRAYLRFRAVVRFRALKNAWTVEKAARTLLQYNEQRLDIKVDRDDILADARDERFRRKAARKRLAELKDFISEAELRLPKIEEDVEALEDADVEAGWAEALEKEWERLGSQLTMAVEETRLQKISVRDSEARLQRLQLEYEDVEADLDAVGVREQEELEMLRRLEIRRGDDAQRADRDKRVRTERMRWRVPDVRVRVLKRQDVTKKALVDAALHARRREISSTLSTKVRLALIKGAKDEGRRHDADQRAEAQGKSAQGIGDSLTKLGETYDGVVSGCAGLLQSFSHAHRLNAGQPEGEDDSEIDDDLF